MQSWKQCALPATTMTIWQIKPSAHDVPLQLCSSCAKCMSCDEAIDVITGRSHCFHDCIYIMPVLLLWDLSNVCRGSLTTTYLIYTYIDRCNIASHFSLSCFRYMVNSSVDRTEAKVWMWPMLTTFVKLYCNRLGSSVMLC